MLYVSFGLEKAGSSLTANLTRHLLESAGHPHLALSAQDRMEIKNNGKFGRHGGLTNNVNNWAAVVVENALRLVPEDRIVMLRTHARPGPEIMAAIAEGRAKCHIALRDLRDIALSINDVLKRRKALNKPEKPGLAIGDFASLFPILRKDVESAYRWAEAQDAIILEYENTAFDPSVSIDAICEHLGLSVPACRHEAIFADAVANPNGKLNVGTSKRHRREMAAEDQAAILEHFADFYARFYPDARVDVEAAPGI